MEFQFLRGKHQRILNYLPEVGVVTGDSTKLGVFELPRSPSFAQLRASSWTAQTT
jgi:hypothetical protein